MTAAERQRKRRAALRDAATAVTKLDSSPVTKPDGHVTKCISAEEYDEYCDLGTEIIEWVQDICPRWRLEREDTSFAAGYVAAEPEAAARWLTLALTSSDPAEGEALRAFRDALIDEIARVDKRAIGENLQPIPAR